MLAGEIMRELSLDFDEAIILAQALKREDLISRYNRDVHSLVFYLDLIEDLQPAPADEEELAFSTMLGVQQRVFDRRR